MQMTTSTLALLVCILAVGAALPSTDPPAVINPGDLLSTELGTSCTVGFLLDEMDEEGGDTGTDWFVTAGHCFQVQEETLWKEGTGPSVTVEDGVVGRAVYAHKNWPRGIDVAIVRLNVDEDMLDPSVCFFGGPAGVTDARPEEGATLLLSGRGGLVHPREVTATADQHTWIQYRGYHAGGDSGSPIMNEAGEALGIHATGGIATSDLSTGSASKLAEMLALAESALDTDFEIMVAEVNGAAWPQDLPEHECSDNVAIT